MLNKNNFLIASAVDKSASAFIASNILITEHETVATDGHVMVAVTRPAPGEAKDITIPAAIAVQAARECGKTGFAVISNGGANIRVQVRNTTLETPCEDLRYPNWRAVIEDKRPIAYDIVFDPAMLARRLKMFSDAGAKAVTMRFADDAVHSGYTTRGHHIAARLDAVLPAIGEQEPQHMSAVIMPMDDKSMIARFSWQRPAPAGVNDSTPKS